MGTGFPRGRPKKGEIRPPKPEGRGQGWRKGQLTYSPEELNTKYKNYFKECKAKERKPTWPGLAGFLDVTTETLRVWFNNDEDKYNDVSVELKKASDALSDEIQQRTDSMAIFQLKQNCYGGYTDTPAGEINGSLNINITFGDTKIKD